MKWVCTHRQDVYYATAMRLAEYDGEVAWVAPVAQSEPHHCKQEEEGYTHRFRTGVQRAGVMYGGSQTIETDPHRRTNIITTTA